MSRDPGRLPSLGELGDRLGEAAAREITAEQGRRRIPRKPFLLGAIVVALAGAGTVTATRVFIGSGDPVQPERQGAGQAGVLTDSAAADPGGGLPWAVRVFIDDKGRECLQLGRLRDGTLGTVYSGQFHAFAGEPNGNCGHLRTDGYSMLADQRVQPAKRTIVYGRVLNDDPVRIGVDGETRTVRPGALGAYVTVFDGIARKATVTLTVKGRRITRRIVR